MTKAEKGVEHLVVRRLVHLVVRSLCTAFKAPKEDGKTAKIVVTGK
ncbi:MAG: hypothetical protein LBR00_07930 [Clostridiales Family XIII bacterium]|nr:hypothetical protein [Clostridiales Family XIII bacterium]